MECYLAIYFILFKLKPDITSHHYWFDIWYHNGQIYKVVQTLSVVLWKENHEISPVCYIYWSFYYFEFVYPIKASIMKVLVHILYFCSIRTSFTKTSDSSCNGWNWRKSLHIWRICSWWRELSERDLQTDLRL